MQFPKVTGFSARSSCAKHPVTGPPIDVPVLILLRSSIYRRSSDSRQFFETLDSKGNYLSTVRFSFVDFSLPCYLFIFDTRGEVTSLGIVQRILLNNEYLCKYFVEKSKSATLHNWTKMVGSV